MFLPIVLAVLIVLFLVEAVLTEVEHWGWASITLIGTLVGLHFLHVWSVYEFFRAYTLEGVVGVAGYIGAGLVWSFVKWFSFLMGFRDAYREEKDKFLMFKKLQADAVLTPELQEQFLKGLSNEGRHNYNYIKGPDGRDILDVSPRWYSDVMTYKGNSLNVRPRAAKNKARITSWAIFWPFSMVGTIVNDPLRRLWNLIWGWVKGLYQKMADKMLAAHPELK